MPELYYTAVIKDGKVFVDENGFVYAEHFEDATERDKRAKQFDGGAPEGSTLYSGTEPPEAFVVRLNARPTDSETIKEDDGPEAIAAKQKAIHDRVNSEAAKAGAKTVSVLTAPEVDDSHEKRGLPDWAVAQNAVEAATQAVIEAKADAEVKVQRAHQLADYAQGQRAPDSDPVGKEAMNQARAAAEGAQVEADRATANLYKAENDLKAKIAEYDKIKPKSEKK